MNKWNRGDVIICINSDNFPSRNNKKEVIREGLKYVINEIRTCPTCHMMEFKLSLPSTSNNVSCVACGTQFAENEIDCWWAEHWRFRKDESYKMEFKFV